MATGPCHGGWGAAIINYPPPAQQTAPVPPPLWVEVRARFRFYRVPCRPMAGAAEFHHCHAVFFCNEVSFRKTKCTMLQLISDHLRNWGNEVSFRKTKCTIPAQWGSTPQNILRPRHKKLSTLMIYSTTKCQSRCKHCSIWQKSEEHLSLHNIQTIMASQCITKYKHWYNNGRIIFCPLTIKVPTAYILYVDGTCCFDYMVAAFHSASWRKHSQLFKQYVCATIRKKQLRRS